MIRLCRSLHMGQTNMSINQSTLTAIRVPFAAEGKLTLIKNANYTASKTILVTISSNLKKNNTACMYQNILSTEHHFIILHHPATHFFTPWTNWGQTKEDSKSEHNNLITGSNWKLGYLEVLGAIYTEPSLSKTHRNSCCIFKALN